MIFGIINVPIIHFINLFRLDSMLDNDNWIFNWKLYSILIVQMALNSFAHDFVIICLMVFAVRIVDPIVGATYLATLRILGLLGKHLNYFLFYYYCFYHHYY